MEKKLYFKFSDNADVCEAVTDLSGAMKWIESDISEHTEFEVEEIQYTLTPIWLTDEEFNNLGEANV